MSTTTPTITPAMRINAQRVERASEPASLEARALRKAAFVESRPHSYTEPMLRWAERLSVAVSLWDGEVVTYADVLALAAEADEAGWL